MSKYVLDSWAWIEYFQGAPKGKTVKEIILDARNEVYTHCVSVAEIISKAKQTGKDVEAVFAAIATDSNIVEASFEDSKKVGITHAVTRAKNRNFSLADAFVLTTSRKIKAKVLTGDPDFKGIDEAILL
jgi:predicted nucleic acid-binding protein